MKKGFILVLLACSTMLFTCKKDDDTSQGSFTATIDGTNYQVNDTKVMAVFQKHIPPQGFTIRYKSISIVASLPNGFVMDVGFVVPLDADSNSTCVGVKDYYSLGSDSSDAQEYEYADGSTFSPYTQGSLVTNGGNDVYGSIDSAYATITACDEANQTISGTFRFKGEGYGQYGETVWVTNGAFTNVHYTKH